MFGYGKLTSAPSPLLPLAGIKIQDACCWCLTAVVDHSVVFLLHFKLLVKDEPNPSVTELLAPEREHL